MQSVVNQLNHLPIINCTRLTGKSIAVDARREIQGIISSPAVLAIGLFPITAHLMDSCPAAKKMVDIAVNEVSALDSSVRLATAPSSSISLPRWHLQFRRGRHGLRTRIVCNTRAGGSAIPLSGRCAQRESFSRREQICVPSLMCVVVSVMLLNHVGRERCYLICRCSGQSNRPRFTVSFCVLYFLRVVFVWNIE